MAKDWRAVAAQMQQGQGQPEQAPAAPVQQAPAQGRDWAAIARQMGAGSESGLTDPTFMPGGVYPRAQVAPEPGGRRVSARSMVTGEGRMDDPNLPDIQEMTGIDSGLPELRRLALSDGLLVASEPAQVVDIALKQLPGATARTDSQGNPIIDYGGRSFYAWKPGFRQQDARRLLAQGAVYGAGGAAANAGGSVVARMLASLGITGATSAGLDIGAMAAGSKQGISIPRAVTTGVMGAAGAGFLGPAQSLARAATRRPGAVSAGIDPATMGPEMSSAFAQEMRRASDPQQAMRMAESQSLPVPVRETAGTISQSPNQQMFENLAAKGAYGQQAENVMRGVKSAQQEQLRGNVDAIQGRLSGGEPVLPQPGMGGAMAQNELQQAQSRTQAAVSGAYDAARGAPAVVAQEMVDSLAGKVAGSAGDFSRVVDSVRMKLGDLRAIGEGGAASVDDLFRWRSDVSKLYRSAPDPQAAAGLKTLLTGFDENVDDLVRSSLMAGDETAARKWLRAVNIRRGEGRRFQGNDLISDLLETEYAGGRSRLKVAPEAASNYVFGKANLGFMTRPELARDMMRLRQRLGRESEGWRALREEAFLRFAQQAEGGFEGGTRGFSGVKFAKAWEDASKKNPELMNVLFTEPERNLITQFSRVAARVTNPVRGGDNPSGTAIALSNMAQKMVSTLTLGPVGAAVLSKVMGPVKDIASGARAMRSAAGRPAVRQPLPRGTTAAGGALVGSQAGAEPQRPVK